MSDTIYLNGKLSPVATYILEFLRRQKALAPPYYSGCTHPGRDAMRERRASGR